MTVKVLDKDMNLPHSDNYAAKFEATNSQGARVLIEALKEYAEGLTSNEEAIIESIFDLCVMTGNGFPEVIRESGRIIFRYDLGFHTTELSWYEKR